MGSVVNKVTGTLFGTQNAPKTPDYAAAAQATADSNKAAALTTGALNRPTQVTPTGSQSWSLKEGADPNNPQPGDWIATTTYSPEQQKLYEGGVKSQQGLVDTANIGVGGLAGLGIGQGLGDQIAPSFTGDVSKTAGEFSADRQAISDALYANQTKYLGDQFARDDESLRSQLLSRGLTEGSSAYENALRDQQRTQNDAYGTAANNATTQSAEMQKLMQDALLNSATTQQNLYNSGLAGAATEQNQPLNQILALLGGGQVSSPNLQSYGQYGQYQGADMLGAARSRYDSGLAGAKFNNELNAQNMQDLGQMATALFASSDRRLKSNIRPICSLPSGQTLYAYNIFGQPSVGVMADETAPEAVVTLPSGYQAVDYSQIGA